MSKKEKSAAKTKTARKFLAAQESTKTGIQEQKAVIDKYRNPTPSRAEKRPMTAVKKAWQRAKRLEEAGIVNDAVAKYNQDKAKIEKSKLSRAEKNKLKQAVAEEFLKQTTSTQTGIKKKFEPLIDERVEAVLERLAPEKRKAFMADYVDAAETSKAYLLAKALDLASDQTSYNVDRLKDVFNPQSQEEMDFLFIESMHAITDFILENGAEPDAITRFIEEWRPNK
jgi:hypothetical protein